MLKTLKEVINNQSGSVIVLVTLALLALVASMALVIDVGLVFAQRIKASNAIDAAVIYSFFGPWTRPAKSRSRAGAKSF